MTGLSIIVTRQWNKDPIDNGIFLSLLILIYQWNVKK